MTCSVACRRCHAGWMADDLHLVGAEKVAEGDEVWWVKCPRCGGRLCVTGRMAVVELRRNR